MPEFYRQYINSLELNVKENTKSPKRFDVINYLLGLTPTKRYLEIGVRNPDACFNKIEAKLKVSVDPGVESEINLAQIKLTSDDFFRELTEGKLNIGVDQFDVIFVDGLHLADQVYKDICNSLKILANPGFLVLHDCNPPDHLFARELYREATPAGGIWNGTTWKAFQRFRCEFNKLCVVVDSDWGVGVIAPHVDCEPALDQSINPFYEFQNLKTHRENILNLVSFEQLKSRLA
ncbi:class I SAM-dependent methyltransferase [Pirellulaceae bacterium SH467]